jgi:kynurenine 3-monooxygenase
MNAAFEDCALSSTNAWPSSLTIVSAPLPNIFARRKENADALADLAVHNFMEMRDKTASRTFRAKKKLDHTLEGLLPGLYLPLYTMVSFTRIPYAEAARRARRQDVLVYASLTVLAVLFLVSFMGLFRMLTD